MTDGFYCIFLAPDDALKLTVMMPHYDGEPQLAAIPLLLTMGWTKSLPTFSATSKMAADLANVQLTTQCHQLPCHCLEYLMSVHDNWESPSVMLVADTAMLVAGTTPSVTLTADTAMLIAGTTPSVMLAADTAHQPGPRYCPPGPPSIPHAHLCATLQTQT